MPVCTSIEKLKEVSEDTDILRVVIDNDVKAYMIFNYAESLVFLNEEVIVSYRKDIYEGKIELFINTLTIPVKITTLDKDKGIKLFTEQSDNNSNVSFMDLAPGSNMLGAIMYCISSSYESSDRAVWLELKVRDKAGRVAKLRLFDPEFGVAKFDGMYIKASIKRNDYGLSTREIRPMDLEFPPNPEVQIARTYIESYFAGDADMCAVLQRTKLLDYMQDYIELELGYALIRAAIQLDILTELRNVFNEVNFKAIAYAIMMQYGYIAKASLVQYSASLRAITFAMQQNLPNDVAALVLMILDEGEPDGKPVPEKAIFKRVLNLANEIIKVKKVV